jgi:hypothetical protein
MIEIKPLAKDGTFMGKYSSTYATCQSLLSLKIARGDSLKVQKAIKDGLNWLMTNRNKAKWRDYPSNREEATFESKSISGLALHTLNNLGVASEEINQLWLENLDMTDAVNPINIKEQSDVFYRLGEKSEHFHIVIPWLMIATVDAYHSGTLRQKTKANVWLSKVIKKINQKELQDMFPFERAELLIGLRYLLENRAAL